MKLNQDVVERLRPYAVAIALAQTDVLSANDRYDDAVRNFEHQIRSLCEPESHMPTRDFLRAMTDNPIDVLNEWGVNIAGSSRRDAMIARRVEDRVVVTVGSGWGVWSKDRISSCDSMGEFWYALYNGLLDAANR